MIGCDVFGSDDTEVPTSSKSLIIANQGNFSDENGTISKYNIADSTSVASILSGFSGLPQSITVVGDKAYLMVNSSTFNGGRIDVVDLNTDTRVDQFPDVAAPRFMASTPSRKGYVSNLFNGTVTVFNLTSGVAIDTISVGSNPEGVVLSSNKIIVANYGFGADSTLSIIDPSSDEVTDTVDLGCDGPRTLLPVTGHDEIVVVCLGNTLFDSDFNVIGRTDGQILFFDTSSLTVTTRIDNLDTQLGAASLGQDAAIGAGRVYVIRDEELIVLDLATRSLTAVYDIQRNVSSVYSVDDRLYLGVYDDFTTSGDLLLLDKSGNVTSTVRMGIAPAYITSSSF